MVHDLRDRIADMVDARHDARAGARDEARARLRPALRRSARPWTIREVRRGRVQGPEAKPAKSAADDAHRDRSPRRSRSRVAHGAAVPAAQRRASAAARRAARDGAPIDLTGYWVSVVSEDWRHRMATARKGDFESVPLNAEGRRGGRRLGPRRRQRGRAAVQGVRRRRAHAPARPAAHHLAGRRHAARRFRRGHADAAASFGDAAAGVREDVAGLLARAVGCKPPPRDRRAGARADRQQRGPVRAGRRRPGPARRTGARRFARRRAARSRSSRRASVPGYLRKNGVPYSEDARDHGILPPLAAARTATRGCS